jgi:hypothetical protein
MASASNPSNDPACFLRCCSRKGLAQIAGGGLIEAIFGFDDHDAGLVKVAHGRDEPEAKSEVNISKNLSFPIYQARAED